MPYGPIIASEHVNLAVEIEAELAKRFARTWQRFFPLASSLPFPGDCNLVIAFPAGPKRPGGSHEVSL